MNALADLPADPLPRRRSPRCRRFAAAAVLLLAVVAPALPAPAANSLAVGYSRGRPGDRGVEVIVTAQAEVPIHGYSLALAYPTEALILRSFGVAGTHAQSLAPEFAEPRIDNDLGVATLGVIFDFQIPVSAHRTLSSPPSGTPLIVARLVFDIPSSAPGGVHAVRLVDGLGSPASYNRFTEAGQSVVPSMSDGAVFVEGGNVLALEKKLALAGATPNLQVFASVLHPDPMDGFSVAVSYLCGEITGSQVLTLKDATYSGTDLGFLLGARVEFFQTDVDQSFRPRCRSRTAAIFDYSPPFDAQSLPAVVDPARAQTILRLTFGVGASADDAQDYQDLVLEDLDIPGALNNLFLVDAQSVSPQLAHGKIYFSEGSLRGQVVEAVSGSAVAGITVRTEPDGFTALTNAAGAFRIDRVLPGSYALYLSGPGHYPARHAGIVVAGKGSATDAGSLAIYAVPTGGPLPGSGNFTRGNANDDARVDLSDSVFILNWLFKGSVSPTCLQAADANDDDKNDISDSVWMLNWLFLGGPGLPPPHPSCGPDPNRSPLSCDSVTACP
jgi:hypothetical protein